MHREKIQFFEISRDARKILDALVAQSGRAVVPWQQESTICHGFESHQGLQFLEFRLRARWYTYSLPAVGKTISHLGGNIKFIKNFVLVI